MQVEELKASRARKLKARAKYEEYVRERTPATGRGNGGGGRGGGPGVAGDEGVAGVSAGGRGPVDYKKWDLWCPSDEEDELFTSLAPQDPGFRAMERDINERHRRCACAGCMQLNPRAAAPPSPALAMRTGGAGGHCNC